MKILAEGGTLRRPHRVAGNPEVVRIRELHSPGTGRWRQVVSATTAVNGSKRARSTTAGPPQKRTSRPTSRKTVGRWGRLRETASSFGEQRIYASHN
jgi:hypothetical protein